MNKDTERIRTLQTIIEVAESRRDECIKQATDHASKAVSFRLQAEGMQKRINDNKRELASLMDAPV